MIIIKEFNYSGSEIRTMSYWQYATNWPVVYIMHNDTDAYVGETLDGIRRTKQHLDEKSDTEYKLICMMTDKNFNKSVALDMESFLIKYMSADGKYKIHNGNTGIVDHNYFNRDIYRDEFKYTWSCLRERGLANHTIDQIENSELFKYSPYKTLTYEQEDALDSILKAIYSNINESKDKKMIVVNGEAGTGKTILAVYLVKLLKEISDGMLNTYQKEDEIERMDFLNKVVHRLKHMKVGFVVPMQSLRESLKKVFRSIEGLTDDMILKPSEVADDYYDLLIVDEAHRLHRRKNLAQYPIYDKVNSKLGLDKESTELDWIIKSSKMQLIFYDREQSVRPSDIDFHLFKNILEMHKCEEIQLSSQLRCRGGKDYIEYVKNVLNEREPMRNTEFGDYDLRIYDNPNEMIRNVRMKNNEINLCRVVAGYGWKWKSGSDKNEYDIILDGEKYRWNSVTTDWVDSPNSVNEIGCIHTIQGYDLNIAGVIFGPEIKYNDSLGTIEIDKNNYYDNLGKTTDVKALKEYIVNIYVTLMTRGIKGTYVYVCDKSLREYLKKYL